MKIDYVRDDEGEWEGVYLDGLLAAQGHSLKTGDVLRTVVGALAFSDEKGLTFASHYLRIDDRLPETFKELEDVWDST